MKTLLNNKQASQFLNIATGTLSNSRSTGKLLGVDAPPYEKVGSSIKYDLEQLNEWLDKVKTPTNHPLLKWNYNNLLVERSSEIVDECAENILIVIKTVKYKNNEIMYETFYPQITSYNKALKDMGDESITPMSDGKHITIEKWCVLTSDFITHGLNSSIKLGGEEYTPLEIAERMNQVVEHCETLCGLADSEKQVHEIKEKTKLLLDGYNELMIKLIYKNLNAS